MPQLVPGSMINSICPSGLFEASAYQGQPAESDCRGQVYKHSWRFKLPHQQRTDMQTQVLIVGAGLALAKAGLEVIIVGTAEAL